MQTASTDNHTRVGEIYRRENNVRGLLHALGNLEFLRSAARSAFEKSVHFDPPARIEELAKYADGRLTVDFNARVVLVDGAAVKLTSLEFKLLAYLIQNAGRVIAKQELFEKVWTDKFTGDGTLNVHIRKIREAIEQEPGNPRYIITVWGDGYKFMGRNQ